MAECPSDKLERNALPKNGGKLDVLNLCNALKEVSDWYQLGIALGILPHELRKIEKDYQGSDRQKTETLDLWLRLDTNATWSNVVSALQKINEHAVAKRVHQNYIAGPASPPVSPTSSITVSPTESMSKSVVFVRENLEVIKARFADLQTRVCVRLEEIGVDIGQFRLFVTNQFPPGYFIPAPPTTLKEVFEAITHHELWDYFHYTPLVQIVRRFGSDDPKMEAWIKKYKKDLKSYQLVATIEDYIEPELNKSVGPPPAKRAKHDCRYLCPVEWKTDFIDHSLKYLAEVWELFSAYYLVPESPPTALLDHIHRGCVSITWLVPSGLIPQLINRAKIDTKFFQEHRIIKVTVGDQCVYETETLTEVVQASSRKDVGVDQYESGGYDCEIVNPPPASLPTMCNICLLVPCNPMQTSCGHIFCKTCIEKLQKMRCPICKEKEFTTFPDKRLQKSLNKLKVRCTWQKSGCDWTGELRELDSHLSIQCEFSSASVQKLPVSKEQLHHLAENAEDKQTKEQEKQLRKLSINGKQETIQQTQELSPKLQLTSHPEPSSTKFLVNHQFTMTEFERYKKYNAEWYSPPFHTHEQGYKMCVRIDANGYGKERGTYVSLYICFMKGKHDNHLPWPFHGEIAVELLNQNTVESGKGVHHKCTIRYDDSTHDFAQRVELGEKRLAGKGESQFISHSELKPDCDSEIQYLKDNSLKFRLSVLHVELPESHSSSKQLELYKPEHLGTHQGALLL